MSYVQKVEFNSDLQKVKCHDCNSDLHNVVESDDEMIKFVQLLKMFKSVTCLIL